MIFFLFTKVDTKILLLVWFQSNCACDAFTIGRICEHLPNKQKTLLSRKSGTCRWTACNKTSFNKYTTYIDLLSFTNTKNKAHRFHGISQFWAAKRNRVNETKSGDAKKGYAHSQRADLSNTGKTYPVTDLDHRFRIVYFYHLHLLLRLMTWKIVHCSLTFRVYHTELHLRHLWASTVATAAVWQWWWLSVNISQIWCYWIGLDFISFWCHSCFDFFSSFFFS